MYGGAAEKLTERSTINNRPEVMYGFFSDTEGKDYFGHFSAIQMEGFRTSDKGQQVRFEVQESSKGSVAANVQPI